MRELLDRSLRGDVHVEFDFPEGLWPVEVDPGELELVVLNLAVNARDAMPDGGTIVVRGENLAGLTEGELAGDYVRLSVIDTGHRHEPRRSWRGSSSPSSRPRISARARAWGLLRSTDLRRSHAGWFESKSVVDEGTSIELYLPRSRNIPSGERHLIDLNGRGPRRPIWPNRLLVEDDDEVAALVSEMLAQLGYEVIRAASAAAALGALADGRAVDLVFSDS